MFERECLKFGDNDFLKVEAAERFKTLKVLLL